MGAFMILISREIREPMTRAFGYLKQQRLEQALGEMSCALRLASQTRSSVQVQKEIERKIRDFLLELERNPRILRLVEGCVAEGGTIFPYRTGQEKTLAIVLEGIGRILQKQDVYVHAQDSLEKEFRRCETLLQTGKEYLEAGQNALALAFFMRILAEFPNDETLWQEPFQLLMEKGCVREAASFCAAVIEKHPKLSEVYTQIIKLFMDLQEYGRAEEIFLRFLRIFGDHPKTYVSMAKLYLEWEKWDAAQNALEKALQLDPHFDEAKTILQSISQKSLSQNMDAQ